MSSSEMSCVVFESWCVEASWAALLTTVVDDRHDNTRTLCHEAVARGVQGLVVGGWPLSHSSGFCSALQRGLVMVSDLSLQVVLNADVANQMKLSLKP